jgi:hypothetical protein
MAKILIDQILVNDSIAKFHQSGYTLVGVMTGAGAGLQKLLWNIAGASQSVILFHFPYSQESLEKYIGLQKYDLPKFLSKDMAYMMASVASFDCKGLSIKRKNPKTQNELDEVVTQSLGLAITAAVTTNRDRRGENRAHIALNFSDKNGTNYVEIVFTKGILSREEEGEIIDLIALNLLLKYCGLKTFDIRIDVLSKDRTVPFTCNFNQIDIKPIVTSISEHYSFIYEF